MLKKTINYTDYNGTQRTEDFYFNLTRSEIAELEYNTGSGMTFTDMISELVASQDVGKIIVILKEIILKSYGVKSDDGRRFIKNADVREAFEQNPAFDELYITISTDAEKAAEFIAGILPASATENMEGNVKDMLLQKATAQMSVVNKQ